MFDVGFSEMFMILVIALIVIGPEKLPAVAKKIGKYIGKAKRSFDNIKREVQSEIETEELNKRLKENNILKEPREAINDLSNELKDIAEEGNKIIPETKNLKS